MDSSMRVLHINSYYQSNLLYKNLFEEQLKQNMNIEVFVPVSKNFCTEKLNYGDYSLVCPCFSQSDRFLFHVKHTKILKSVQKKFSVDSFALTHAHSLFSNGYISLQLKKKYGVPYIVSVQNTDVNVFFRKMFHLRNLGRKILNEADHIIFVSKPYKDYVFHTYFNPDAQHELEMKTSIIPYGIDKFWFDNKNSQKKMLSLPQIKLVQIGDISRNKNIERTIEACYLLRQKGYVVSLEAAGRPIDRTLVAMLSEKCSTTYLGLQSRNELLQIYRNNDILILPSINETFGLVYAEAMTQGLPLIYTRGQGFDKQFDDGVVGFPVNCHDPHDIVDNVISIIQDYDHISHNCLQLCLKFRWNVIAHEYKDVYESLLCE